MIRWLDHTADVQIEIISDSFEGVFVELVEGLRTLLITGDCRGDEGREIDLREPSAEELIVSMGRSVLRFFYGEAWISCRFEPREAAPTRMKGILWGEPYDLQRHQTQIEVKGITYHDLVLERLGVRWRAVVTFDV